MGKPEIERLETEIAALDAAELRARRHALGLSQASLARELGVAANTVARWERGELSIRNPALIRHALDRLSTAPASGVHDSGRRHAVHPQLPFEPNALVGRQRALEAVLGNLRRPEVRLLTLTGPGGVGKTRLALAVAKQLQPVFADGTWFVDLSLVRDTALVLPKLAQVLGVREAGHRPAHDLLVDHLRERQVLLVLDNMEQVLGAAAGLSQVLAECLDVKALVTSREPLRLRWEHVYALEPLEAPARGIAADPHAVVRFPAVALFVERAHAADANFALTEQNAAAVAELSRRLDGLPLAIELAAALVRALPPAAILARLARGAQVRAHLRDAPDRQQSLHAAIAWSYDMLPDQERLVFRRLSIFAGGCTLEAAEAICGEGTHDIVQTMAELVDKSLLVRETEPTGEPRFRLLETVRAFAQQQVTQTIEERLVGGNHAAFFLDVAERAEPELTGPNHADWLARLEREHDNLREALHWLLQHRQTHDVLRLSGALWRFWYMRGYLHEGQQWLERALACDGEAPAAARMKALNGAGYLYSIGTVYARATELHEACLRLAEAELDPARIAGSLHNLALVARYRQEYGRAVTLDQQAFAKFEALGDRRGSAIVLLNLGLVHEHRGELADARALYERYLAIMEAIGDEGWVC